MEIKISKSNFLKAGLMAEKITGKNLNLPILSSFLISTQKGKIKITATNLEIGFEISVPAKIIQEGRVAVPAKIINSIIFNLKDDVLILRKENSNLKIITDNSVAILKTNSLDDFPILPKFKKENSFQVKLSHFLGGLKSVFFAASSFYLKPEIASIYFYNKGNQFIFTATDSFRLAEKNILNNNSDILFALLFPIKSVQELIYILNETEDKEQLIEICFNKNEFFIFNDVFCFFNRLTEGNFVDYKQIIPNTSLGEIIIDNEKCVNILKTAAIFSNRLNEIILEIYPDRQIVEFKTSNPELGEYYSKSDILKTGFKDFKGDVIKKSFNLKYLLEGIGQIISPRIIFKINEEGKPIVIQGENDLSFIYLVMPMKL